uniref:TLC domain containing 4b n=1 Tax=Cyprinus carpio TaxID=7962 RepID=A0A8C2F6H0_CYPCA
ALTFSVYVVAGSFVGFQVLFSCVSPVLSSNFTEGYGKLPPNKLNDWNSRLVSTIHALIVGLFCVYILWYDDAVNEDPFWGDPNLVKLNVAITCGYLFYGMKLCFILLVCLQFFLTLLVLLPSPLLLSDLVLLACNWSAMGDVFFVCHHLAALYAYGFVLVSTWNMYFL